MEFQIPLSREDLLRREGSHYAVPDCCTSGELVTRLEECRATLDGGRLQSITECFPVFYCLMRNFLRVGKSLREAYWRIAAKALEGACHQVGGANIGGMNQLGKSEMRNCLKMMVYVIVQLVEEFENEATKPDSLDMASGPKRGRKKKGATAAGSESHSSGLDWGQERERVVEVMCDLVECDLWLLWEPPSAQMMEDFSNLLLSLCYKLLENPGFVREKNARQKVIFLVGTLIKRYSMGLSVGMKVPQLLQHFEHLVSPLAQALQCWAQEFGAKSVVAEVVRELGRKDPRDLSHDASGTRSFATFLVELSQYVPAAILPSISVLLPHLGGESYTMRNGVLGVIGETISQVLSSPQLDNQTKLTRDKLLDRLQQHLHDVNAFVRSKCLQIWLQLCNAKAIPLPRLKAVLPLVVGRTQDKSSNVRKNAVQLLTGLMAANPFAAKLDETEFQTRLTVEETKLKSMLPPESDVEDVTAISSEPTAAEEEENDKQTKSGEGREGQEWTGEEGEGEGGEGGGEGGEGDEEGERGKVEGGERGKVEGGSVGEGKEKGSEEKEDIAKQIAVVKYLRDGLEFIKLMTSCIPVCTRLLGSRVNSDVLESLEFLSTAVEFQVHGSRGGVRKSLVLVWSQEQQIRDSVVHAYVRLYLKPEVENPHQVALMVVQNLMSLTQGANYGELTSLEEMMGLLVRGKFIPAPVVKMLWDIFTHSAGNVTQSHSRSAVLLLSMIAGAEREVVKTNLKLLVAHGLNSEGENPDLVIAKYSCIMLQKLVPSRLLAKKGELTLPLPRFSPSHPMFQQMATLLISQFSSPSSHWVPFAEQAIVAIYKLAEHPDKVCGGILKALAKMVYGEKRREVGEGEQEGGGTVVENPDTPPSSQASELSSTTQQSHHVAPISVDSLSLSRLLFAVGHVAQWQVIHLEGSVSRELKRRRETAVEQRERTFSSKTGRTPGRTPAARTPGKPTDSPSLEEELGLSGATADDSETDLIRRVCEVEVASTGLLSLFEPLIVGVVSNPSKFSCALLQTSAVLALAKYMMMSHSMCDRYLQLLFTVLEKSSEPAIRANTIIAAGDLSFRYPNLTEPWTPHLYSRLRDSSPLVRKNTLTVLTHLILNDMIKVKGQISEVALILEDSESDIADKAKLFFTQLAKKGNDIYNVLPNIISNLSDPQREVPREKFQSITKFLFSFIQKDRQCESLVEKLCHRFRATRTEQQWRDLAYCLSHINFTERCVRKLQDNFQCFQDKLVDREVYSSFTSITNKAKKFAKPETKALVVELEEMLREAHTKGLEEVGMEGGEGGTGGGGGEKDEQGGAHDGKAVGEKQGEGETEVGADREGEGEGDKENDSKKGAEKGTENSGSLFRAPTAATSRRKARAVATQKTPAKSGVKSKAKLKRKTLKAPLVASNTEEDEAVIGRWSDDSDFKSDVLASARKATIINTGSNPRRKLDRQVRRQKKIRQLVYSSDEDEDEDEKTEEGDVENEGGISKSTVKQKVPARFTFSDDDD